MKILRLNKQKGVRKIDNCNKWQEYISLYTDDLLNSEEILELLEHLDECDECHKLYLQVKQIKENLKGIEIKYPENLTESIMSKIEFEKDEEIVQIKPPRRKFQYIGLVACACFAIIFSSFNILDSLQVSNNADTYTTTTTALTSTSSDNVDSISSAETDKYETNDLAQPASEPQVISGEEQIESRAAATINEETDIAQNSLTNSQESTASESVSTDSIYIDYAFVYAFVGDLELPKDIEGSISVVDENTVYIEISNNLPIAERVISTLEQNGYENINVDSSTYVFSTDSDQGLIIIKSSIN